MSHTISGTYRDGQIRLEEPVDWPEGARVEVSLSEPARPRVGLTEEEWPTDPEAIEAWLRWYDSLEPLEFTPAEEADLAAWRQKIKEYTISKMHESTEGLFE
jgi:hypothetical protein